MRRERNWILKKMMYPGFFVLMGVMIFSIAEAKTFTIVFSSHDPKGGSWTEIYEPWFAQIEKATHGNVKIEQHWNGELAGLAEAYDAVSQGVVDLTYFLPMMKPNLFPMEDYINFNANDIFVYGKSQLTWELFNTIPELRAPYKKSVKVLFQLVTFPNFFATREGKPIKSFEDCRGMKFIAVGKWDSELGKARGMVPMTVMPPETFMSLQTGVIDGCTMTFPSLFDFQLAPVTPNISLVNNRGAIFCCVMNKEIWNKLSPEYQKVFEDTAAALPAIMDAIQLREYAELQKKIVKEYPKTQIYRFSPEELAKFKKAAAPVRAEFINELNKKGLPGDNLLKTYDELEEKYASKIYEKYDY